MDDIIDLEIEKIDGIIHKIENDPESESIKRVEYELWQKVRDMAVRGRRTGVGITAEGDMLAALGLRYASPEGISVSEHVHKIIATACYTESINMAKERGCFQDWSYQKECENPFIQRVIDNLSNASVVKYSEYGRRNIASLTVAPTGCCNPNTRIYTNRGIISMDTLFKDNGYDLSAAKSEGLSRIWLEPTKEYLVPDAAGNFHKVTKLFINGEVPTKRIITKNGLIEVSFNHKFLVRISDTQAKWVKSEDLKPGDRILKIKDPKTPKSISYINKFSSDCKSMTLFQASTEYHRFSRSTALPDLIIRYGEEKGRELYKKNSENRSYMRTLKGYIDRYGELEGKKRYEETNKLYAGTLSNFIRRYGESEGPIRYQLFCERCAIKDYIKNDPNSGYNNRIFNTRLEYWMQFTDDPEEAKKMLSERQRMDLSKFITLYGADEGKKRFTEYNSRKINTFDNFKRRYGDHAEDAYKNYLMNLSYSHSIDAYIDRYGEEKGIEIFKLISESKSVSLPSMIKKYGDQEGKRRYNEMISLMAFNQSKESYKLKYGADWLEVYAMRFSHFHQRTSEKAKELFNNLQELLSEYLIYLGNKQGDDEYVILDPTKETFYSVDCFIPDKNLVIEFNGTYWHRDPRFFNDEDSKIIQESDKRKSERIRSLGYGFSEIWEYDYDNDRTSIINNLVTILNNG